MNSALKFIIEICVLFIFIKFLIFPIVGSFLGVSDPLVVVMSGSMEHNNEFFLWNSPNDSFYQNLNITKLDFQKFPLHNGLNIGDIVVLHSTKNLSVGDVIVYKVSNGNDIIHRVISLNPIETKGDNNVGQIDFEKNVSPKQIIGKAWIDIPFLGYPKVILNNIITHFR